MYLLLYVCFQKNFEIILPHHAQRRIRATFAYFCILNLTFKIFKTLFFAHNQSANIIHTYVDMYEKRKSCGVWRMKKTRLTSSNAMKTLVSSACVRVWVQNVYKYMFIRQYRLPKNKKYHK